VETEVEGSVCPDVMWPVASLSVMLVLVVRYAMMCCSSIWVGIVNGRVFECFDLAPKDYNCIYTTRYL
jgi:hypothetical protein